MNKSSITKNYFFNLIYEILAIIIPFFTTPYVARVFGAAGIGDYNYINGIVSYFGLIATTGTATFGNREIAVVQNSREKRSELFFELLFFRIICTIIALIPYTVLILTSNNYYRVLYIINLLMFVSWITDVSWFCRGMENFAVTALRNSIVKILGAVMIFALIHDVSDLWIYVLIYSGTMVLGNITMWPYVLKHIKCVKFKNINIFKDTKSIMQLFIPVIAVQIYTVLDRTMLGALDNTVEVGYYSQAHRIIELAMTFINSFISVLLPRIALLYAEKSFNQLNDLLNKTIRYISLLGVPMIVGCWLLIDQFVPIFFGPGYEPTGIIIKILSCMFLVLNFGRLFGTLLVAINQQNRYTTVTIVAASLNLVFNGLFIVVFKLGAIGVAIASVISELSATLLQMWYIRKLLCIRELIESIVAYIIPAIIMAISILVTQMIVSSNEIISLFIKAIVGVMMYFSVLLVCRDTFVKTIITVVVSKIKKR